MKRTLLTLATIGLLVSCKKEALLEIENGNSKLVNNRQGITVIDDITMISIFDASDDHNFYDFEYLNGKLDKIKYYYGDNIQSNQLNFYNSIGRLINYKTQSNYENKNHFCSYNSSGRLSSVKNNSTQNIKNTMHAFKYSNGRLMSYNRGIRNQGSGLFTYELINLTYNSNGDVITRKSNQAYTATNNFSPILFNVVNLYTYTYFQQYDNPFKNMNFPLKDCYVLGGTENETSFFPQGIHFPQTETQNGSITHTYTVLESQGNLPTVYTHRFGSDDYVDTIKIKYTQL
jgi:hypothetical protein